MKKLYVCLFAAFASFFLSGCSEDAHFSRNTSSLLQFEADTISFDTVFSGILTTTRKFFIYNNSSEDIRISSVQLARANSSFRFNIDGISGPNVDNVEVRNGDSTLLLVDYRNTEGSLKPYTEDNDDLLFTLESGVVQKLHLNATALYARTLTNVVLNHDTAITSEIPILVFDSLVVSKGATLTLEPGAHIYFHSGAFLKIDGKIISNGTIDKPVVLRGDRLDNMFSYLPYDRVTAQWGGVRISEGSYDNYLNCTDIHSSCYGIICRSDSPLKTKLQLINSVIHNVKGNALEVNNCKVLVANSQLSNTLGNCLLQRGGDVEIIHSTIANFYPWDSSRDVALRVLSDSAYSSKIVLKNSIVTGYAPDEIMLRYPQGMSSQLSYSFSNCLLKTEESSDSLFLNCIFEKDSHKTYSIKNFPNINTSNFYYDFSLDSLSQAVGLADSSMLNLYPYDRRGIKRIESRVDAGCYQLCGQ